MGVLAKVQVLMNITFLIKFNVQVAISSMGVCDFLSILCTLGNKFHIATQSCISA